MKILVVDDESLLVESLTKYLTKRGHTLESASNGQEGLELFLQHSDSIDIVLVDMQIPLINGLNLLKKIREKHFLTPVILMSGHIEDEIFVEAKKLGVVDCLVKPFKLAQLNNALQKSLAEPKIKNFD